MLHLIARINMKTNNLKTVTIISFLTIVFPGKIAILNAIAIFMSLINFFLMIGVEPPNFDFIVSILTISSLIMFFSKNKYLIIAGVLIQYIYLFYTFNSNYFKYWYYVLPVLIYLILSLILFFSLLFNRDKKKIERKYL